MGYRFIFFFSKIEQEVQVTLNLYFTDLTLNERNGSVSNDLQWWWKQGTESGEGVIF